MTDQSQDPPPQAMDFFNAIAATLDQILNGKEVAKDKTLRRTGFVLLVFPAGAEDNRCNLISNGTDPIKIIRLLRSQIKTLKKQLQ